MGNLDHEKTIQVTKTTKRETHADVPKEQEEGDEEDEEDEEAAEIFAADEEGEDVSARGTNKRVRMRSKSGGDDAEMVEKRKPRTVSYFMSNRIEPKPFWLGVVVIFQGFAVMERLGTPQKQKRILQVNHF